LTWQALLRKKIYFPLFLAQIDLEGNKKACLATPPVFRITSVGARAEGASGAGKIGPGTPFSHPLPEMTEDFRREGNLFDIAG